MSDTMRDTMPLSDHSAITATFEDASGMVATVTISRAAVITMAKQLGVTIGVDAVAGWNNETRGLHELVWIQSALECRRDGCNREEYITIHSADYRGKAARSYDDGDKLVVKHGTVRKALNAVNRAIETVLITAQV